MALMAAKNAPARTRDYVTRYALAPGATLLGVLVGFVPQYAILVLPMLAGAVLLWFSPQATLLLASVSVLVPPAQIGGLGFGLDDIVPILVVSFGAVHLLRHATRDTWVGPYLPPFLLLIASGFVSALANAQGVMSLVALLAKGVVRNGISFLLVLIAYTFTRTSRVRDLLLKSLILVAVIESTFGIFSYLTDYYGPLGIGLVQAESYLQVGGVITSRVVGTLSTSGAGGGSNFLGGYLALNIPLTIGWAMGLATRRSRWLGAFAVAPQIVCLTLTYTRASMACLLLGIVVMIAAKGRLRLLIKWVPVMAFVALLLVMAIPGLAGRIGGTLSERTGFWLTALHMIADKPLAGVGPGQYLASLAQLPIEFWQGVGFFSTAFNPHNTFLFYGVEQGLLAVVAMVWLAGLSLKQAFQVFRRTDFMSQHSMNLVSLGILGGLVTHLSNNLFASLIHLPSLGVYFWLLCGLVWRLKSTTEGRPAVDS